MHGMQLGHIDHIRRINIGLVYKLIDQHGPVSRIELSKISQLAPASITKITRELIDAQLICETVTKDGNSRGRPATGLIINHKDWQFFSFRLGRDTLQLALHLISGENVISDTYPSHFTDGESLLDFLLTSITVFTEKYAASISRIAAIAISLPGFVDSETGTLSQMPYINSKTYPLADRLYEEIGLPVLIGNDIRAWTLAEHFFGKSSRFNDSILLAIHHGIGVGILANGQLLQGKEGNIGDLNHIQVKPYGELCVCGNMGCLHTVATIDAVLNVAKKRLEEGHKSVLTMSNLSLDTFFNAVGENDPLAVNIIVELGHDLANIMSTLINLFNPSQILFGGELNRVKHILYPSIIEKLRYQTKHDYLERIHFDEAKFRIHDTMHGAALIKRDLYNGKLIMKLMEEV